MADLISRAAAIEEMMQMVETHKHEIFRGELLHYTGIKAMIEALPNIDAIPVVRCRDCKHRIVNKNFGKKGYFDLEAMCSLDTGDIFELGRNAWDPDWFCADGERRENDGKDA